MKKMKMSLFFFLSADDLQRCSVAWRTKLEMLWKFHLCVLLALFIVNPLQDINCWPQGCKIIIGNQCYEVYTTRMYYSEAEIACQTNKGRLARITSHAISEKLATHMKKALGCQTNDYNIHRFWIGLNDREIEGNFTYSDGKTLSTSKYIAWAPGEPDDKETGAFVDCDCVSMSAFTQRWYDESCFAYARGYVCEFDSKPCNMHDLFIANAIFDSCHANLTMPYATAISIQCRPGFVITGADNVTCNANGTWSEIPVCQAGCTPPPAIPNAKLLAGKEPYLVGDSVTYICANGFYTDDYPSRSHFQNTCSLQGTWISHNSGCFPFKPYDVKNVELMPGQSTILSCALETTNNKIENGKKWMWLKDSENVEAIFADFIIQSNGSLRVTKFSEAAQGIYICFLGNNIIIPGKLAYELRLKSTPCPKIKDFPKQYVVQETSSVLLPCPNNSSHSTIRWYKDGILLHDNADRSQFPDGSLFIVEANFIDQGSYTCITVFKDTLCTQNSTVDLMILTSEKSICGNVEKARDHPWTVSLWWKDEIAPFCYGILIHESWVVTSAQCLTGFYRRKKLSSYVSFDDKISWEESLPLNDSTTVAVPIASIVIHPAFDKKMYTNDIGLVELEAPVRFTKNIQPICLPDKNISFIGKCGKSMEVNGLVSGWGLIDSTKSEIKPMEEENMILLSEEKCNGTDASYWENIICTVQNNITEPTYAADSGSPLEVEWKGRIYLVGIYSWGHRVKQRSGYDYFTKISMYSLWISSFVDVY